MRRLFLILFLFLATFGTIAESRAQIVPQSKAEMSLSFAPLVKQVTPAVVNIFTRKLVRQRVSPLFADPFFQQFFGCRCLRA